MAARDAGSAKDGKGSDVVGVAKVAEVVACRAEVAEREAAETAAACLDDTTRACVGRDDTLFHFELFWFDIFYIALNYILKCSN